MPAIGHWREHLPYQNTIDIAVSGQKIFAATPYSIFSVDRSTKEIDRISKVSGLNETGISSIAYDSLQQKLFIAYTNSNIDVLANGNIRNIPGLFRSSISGDKSIYNMYLDGNNAYLATGLGIVVVDASKYEIKETWYPSSNGNPVKVFDVTLFNNYFYAATDDGLRSIPATMNAADFRNWQLINGNGLPAGTVKAVNKFNNRLVVLISDSIFIQNGQQWQIFFANGWPVTGVNISDNKLILSQRKPNGEAQVLVVNSNGNIEKTLKQQGYISFPMAAKIVGGDVWIADLYGGLTQWSGNSFESYRPNAPYDISSGNMFFSNNALYVTAGAVNSSWNYLYNTSGFFKYADSWWTNYNRFSHPSLDSVQDIIDVAVNPQQGDVWLGSFGGGLLRLSNEKITVYKQNSPLRAPAGDPGSYRAAGLAFDEKNNLWVSNFGAIPQLHVLKPSGQWQSFTVPFSLRENAVSKIVVDDYSNKWMVSPLGNGIVVFNEGSFENAADDNWKLIRAGSGSGNLPSNEVLSMAKDKNGSIWVGTNYGIAIFECTDQVFSNSGCEAIWPIVKEGNFANYLFKGQEVRDIAVDGANRKWIATTTGAWLVSADGDKILGHFTESNSSLLSDDVKKIAINGNNGEVFFATAKGIISYRSTATNASDSNQLVIIFPNPVPPDFNGDIGIMGLPENSIVKITEMNGRLVFQSKALGGQAIWNGKDYRGNRAASGIYLVFVIDEKKQQRLVGKIVFISRGQN